MGFCDFWIRVFCLFVFFPEKAEWNGAINWTEIMDIVEIIPTQMQIDFLKIVRRFNKHSSCRKKKEFSCNYCMDIVCVTIPI